MELPVRSSVTRRAASAKPILPITTGSEKVLTFMPEHKHNMLDSSRDEVNLLNTL